MESPSTPPQTPQQSASNPPQPYANSPMGSGYVPPASHLAEQTKPVHRLGSFKALLSVVIFVGGIVIAAFVINQFVFQSYYVDGTSMTPTLQNNDRLIIDKVERTSAIFRGQHYIPNRGQIVVLDSSLIDQAGRSEQLIKRVIGLPGDRIIINDDGIVTIKNAEHPEGFDVNKSLGLELESAYVDAPIDITITDGQIFVMGDNRGPGGSFDSRSFGPIDSNKIQGRLLARIFPLNHTGLF